MNFSSRASLMAFALATLALFIVSGCVPAPEQNGPKAEESQVSSRLPTPSASTTGVPVSVSGVTVPEGWEHGGSWTNNDVAGVWGLKTGVAILSAKEKTLSSYNQNGQPIAQSTPVKGFRELRTTDVFASYLDGKSYLLLVQSGDLQADSSVQHPNIGVYYSIMDATNGKITYEKMYDTRSPFDSAGLRSDGSTVSFKAAEEAGTFGKKTYVINSATGEVEATAETKNHRWMARVDGVDLYLDSNPNSQQSTGVSTAQWSIPKGGVDKLTKANDELSPLTYGQYVNLATEKSPCTIIDVHTGVEAKLPTQGKQMCLGRYNDAVMEKEVARLYFGVLPITTLTMDQYFMNPIKEELVPVTNGDPFQSFFTGGDGYVYGSGGANKKLPARVDLAQGEINVLSSGSGGNVIHAASGDSVIAIPLSDAPTNKGYLFLTPN